MPTPRTPESRRIPAAAWAPDTPVVTGIWLARWYALVTRHWAHRPSSIAGARNTRYRGSKNIDELPPNGRFAQLEGRFVYGDSHGKGHATGHLPTRAGRMRAA